MSSAAVDSEATFAARLKAFGLADHFFVLLKEADVNTMAKMAYVSSAVPGLGDDAPWVADMLKACKVTVWTSCRKGTGLASVDLGPNLTRPA